MCIRDRACSGPGPCAHNGAYRATDLSADQSPTYGAGAYELGFGVVTTVMAVRLSNSILMEMCIRDSIRTASRQPPH